MAGSGLFLNSWTTRTPLLLRVFFASAGGGLSASFGKVRGAGFLRTSLFGIRRTSYLSYGVMPQAGLSSGMICSWGFTGGGLPSSPHSTAGDSISFGSTSRSRIFPRGVPVIACLAIGDCHRF
jgi:hypothetical protein